MPPVAVDQIIGNPLVVTEVNNSNVQQQLQNNYAQEFIHFRLTGTLTLASYSANPSKYVESLENLIASLQLQATGRSSGATTDQLCNVDGAFLRFKTHLMEGTDVTRTDVGTANGTYAFETNFKKYFIDPRSNASRLTTMFTSLLSTFTAAFQFRDQSALVYGGTGGTAALSNVQITSQARQYLGLTPPSPSPYVKETQRQYNIIAAQNGYVCDRVPVGNVLRRQYFKGLLGTANWNDPSDTMFAATGKPEGPHIQLVINNAVTKLDQVYGQMRADNKTLFGVETMPTGYAVFEPARNRKLSNSIAMSNVANAQNNIDVNYTSGSTNTIQITDEQLVGLSAAQYNQQR
jgi:hypothetical protein